MKRPRLFAVLATLLTVVSLSALAAPPEAPAGDRCSPKTLQGSYLYTIQGYREGKPYASSGILSFDGNGKATVLWTSSVERAERFTTGTYTLNNTCSGSMTLDVTTVNHFYIAPSGNFFRFVRVSGDGVIATEATRVSHELLAKPATRP